MRILWWILKATNTLWIRITAFPLLQCLQKRVSILRTLPVLFLFDSKTFLPTSLRFGTGHTHNNLPCIYEFRENRLSGSSTLLINCTRLSTSCSHLLHYPDSLYRNRICCCVSSLGSGSSASVAFSLLFHVSLHLLCRVTLHFRRPLRSKGITLHV